MSKKTPDIADARFEVDISIRIITPELAGEWLKQNTINRPVRRSVVEFYAAQMVAKRWQLTGDSIKFDTEGRLIDGQHRLLACIQAGVPFKTAVVHGAHTDIFSVVDTGEKRSGADTLDIEGYRNTNTLAASAKVVYRFLTGVPETLRSGGGGSRGKLTNTETRDIVKAHPGLVRSVDTYNAEIRRLMQPSLGCALHYLFSLKDETLADAFFEGLISGTDLRATDPVHALRERLIAFKSDPKTHPNPLIVAALTVKAWNFVRAGKPCKQLKFSMSGRGAEDFPEVR